MKHKHLTEEDIKLEGWAITLSNEEWIFAERIVGEMYWDLEYEINHVNLQITACTIKEMKDPLSFFIGMCEDVETFKLLEYLIGITR